MITQQKNNFLIKSASYASVITAFIILIVKFYGWWHTDSQSILASLADSFLDISSSIINMLVIRIVFLPPDEDHRFGHEKFQDLAIFSQSIFFFASSLFIVAHAVMSLYLRETPTELEIGTNSMYFSIILTLILVSYQFYVVKKTGSKIIYADRLHYFADLLTNILVVISLHFSYKYWCIDGICSILIAIYILHTSYKIFRSSLGNLVDQEFPNEERDKILDIINNCDEVKGVHQLKTRSAAEKSFIQFHLEVDGGLSLNKAHDISDAVVAKLKIVFPNSEIIVHQDPFEES